MTKIKLLSRPDPPIIPPPSEDVRTEDTFPRPTTIVENNNK